MAETWRFYRFDYTQYLEIRPALRSVTTPAALAALSDSEVTDVIADAAQNGEITVQEARHDWLIAACCIGPPLTLDSAFTRFVAALGRRRGAEEAAETLTELAAGGKNIEAWLMPSFGLIGFLTPTETEKLAVNCAALSKLGRLRSGKKRKVRRGGLFGFVRNFLRRLFDAGPQTDELLPLINALLNEAARNGEGVAVANG